MIKLLASFITILFLAELEPCHAQNPEELKLKNFRPKSIYRVPVTLIKKAKFPAVDMHSHDFAKPSKKLHSG